MATGNPRKCEQMTAANEIVVADRSRAGEDAELKSGGDAQESSQGESGTPGPGERVDRLRLGAILVIAGWLTLFAMYYARTLLMPIAAGIILGLLFRPVVRRGRRYRIPDAISAAFALGSVVAVVFLAFVNLLGPATTWLNDAPDKLQTVGQKLHVVRERVSDLNRASEMMEDLARGDVDSSKGSPKEPPFPFAPDPPVTDAESIESPDQTSSSGPRDRLNGKTVEANVKEPVEVQIQQPRLLAGLQVLSSTGSVLAELLITVVLAYFLMAAGDVLINNVLRLMPSMREKRNVVELVHNVERGISSYLLTVTAINFCLGIAEAFAMWVLGVPNPLLWGVMATVFNFVPFLGALCGTVVILLVSILSFDSLAYAFIPPTVFWLLTLTEGNFITPHILGRSMCLNPIMVFLSLIVWGWMWGVGGALLAVPLLAALKVGFDQFERTRHLGVLLSGDLSSQTS